MTTIHDEQTALWNGHAGRAWVEAQPVLDAMFEPFEAQLVEAVHAASARRVLDVGCGTGSTTLAIARRLGAGGRCSGVDISAPMIAVARERSEREGTPADFICADVQRHAFDAASVDMIVSRFGVMFFDAPVEAFRNLRRAASDEARLHLVAWRGAADNPFMTTTERAAGPLLPGLPARRPGAPGQFAFADRGHVAAFLEQAGWGGIDIRPLDVDCTLPANELEGYFTRLGPVALALKAVDEAARGRIVEVLRAAFQPFVHGDEVHFSAACWQIGAVAAITPA